MNRRTKRKVDAARPARIEAGERLVSYLAGLPTRMARAAAARAEYLLALEWQREQKDMRARGDHSSWVFTIFPEDMADVQRAVMNTSLFGTPLNPNAYAEWKKWDEAAPRASQRADDSNPRAEQHIIDLLSAFPVDQAWWTVHRIREEINGCWFETRNDRSDQSH